MDRKIFLELCQKVSCLPDGVLGIKKDVPEELTVIVDGMRYYPVAYELSFDKGIAVHKGILHDVKANSLKTELLERIKAND